MTSFWVISVPRALLGQISLDLILHLTSHFQFQQYWSDHRRIHQLAIFWMHMLKSISARFRQFTLRLLKIYTQKYKSIIQYFHIWWFWKNFQNWIYVRHLFANPMMTSSAMNHRLWLTHQGWVFVLLLYQTMSFRRINGVFRNFWLVYW